MSSMNNSIKKIEPLDIAIINNMGIHNITSSAKVAEEEEPLFLLIIICHIIKFNLYLFPIMKKKNIRGSQGEYISRLHLEA